VITEENIPGLEDSAEEDEFIYNWEDAWDRNRWNKNNQLESDLSLAKVSPAEPEGS
jgi:hypothetical protein